MKRIIVALSLVLVFAGTLLIVVFAHGGRTDANGGHYNRSTGEYHYHHGYSAHSHYDMDGDGYIDCPYEFDDKTNHGSGKIDRTPETTKKTDLQDLFDKTTEAPETEKRKEIVEEKSGFKIDWETINKMFSYLLNKKIYELPELVLYIVMIVTMAAFVSPILVAIIRFIIGLFASKDIDDAIETKLYAGITICLSVAFSLLALYLAVTH